ncbi:TonB-dependent receptor [Flavobacterium sp. XS2P12]|uniref:TonB-dependent receptor n=1 Tax=Flavobacterium melibiosi TaxID=3398734 RepID=UPI003A88F672
MKKLPFNDKVSTFWLLCLFILSTVTHAQSSGSISGFVKDKSGTSLSGVTIKLSSSNGTNQNTLVDSLSYYNFKNLPSGKYKLVFTRMGHLSSTGQVDVANNEVVFNGELVEDPMQLDAVVVTGGRPKRKIESSVAITTMSTKDIQQRSPLNSTDLLRAIPGLTVESSGGDGPGNVWVRGFPQQGGYVFLGILEDGLPVLPTGFNSIPSADQYYKTDLTTKNIEAIRGGNASIVLANTSGAVVNNISHVGANKSYGQIKLSSGLSQDLYRVDANTGGAFSENIKYNIGGFYRTDKGIVPPGYTANEGGQLKANVTYHFKNNKGYLRFLGKFIDDKIQWRIGSYYSYDGSGKPTALANYDLFTQSMDMIDTKWSYTRASGKVNNYDLSDGMHTKMGAGGFQFNYTTDNGWQINNNFRYQSSHTTVNSTIPLSARKYGSTAQYSYLDGNTPTYSPDDYYVFSVAVMQKNRDKQFINFLDFKKKVNKHSLNLGLGLHQYNVNNEPNDSFVFNQELKNQPRRLLIAGGPFAGNGMLAASTNIRIGNTRILSSYVSDEIALNDKFRLDLGFRVDNHHIDGKRPYYGVNADGTPNTSAAASMNIVGRTDYSVSNTNWALSTGLNNKINEYAAMFARLTRAYNTPTLIDYGAAAYKESSIKKRPVLLAELGYKYANNGWSLFSSVSYSTIKNVSLNINVPTNIGLQALLAFGSTRTLSAEYEIAYKVSNNLGLRLTGTLQDSKYTDYTASTKTNPIVLQQMGDVTYSFTGNATERVPVLSTELAANYDYKKFYTNWGIIYTGSRYTSPAQNYKLPGYVTMRASVGYKITNTLEAKFWADNLTNTRAITEGDVRGDQFRDFTTVAKGTPMYARTILPRSFWASLSYSFK